MCLGKFFATMLHPPFTLFDMQHDNIPKNLNAFYWYQIFALDSAVVEVQEMFSSHGGHLTNAMYHHEKHSNQINTP